MDPHQLFAAPASFSQQGLWYQAELDPGSAAYHVPFALRMRGVVDASAIRAALQALVDRHESLRTTFVWQDDGLTQIIHASAVVSFSTDEAPADDGALQARIHDEIHRPFDLARGPLARFVLFRRSDDEAVLVGTIHHLVTDGWSVGVLKREFAAAYAGEPLPELPIQYADYAEWQGEQRAEAWAGQIAYWRDRLRGPLPPAEFPFDVPRNGPRTMVGGTERIRLQPATLVRLRRLAADTGTTLFMTLVASFKVLMFRHTQEPDVVVGTPLANRNRPELEGLVGFFVNMQVLRTDLSGSPRFVDLLARVKDTTLGAFSHQDVPFEVLASELTPDRSSASEAFYRVVFALQNAGRGTLALPGMTVESLDVFTDTAKQALTFVTEEVDDTLEVRVEFNSALYSAETARRLARRYERLLEAVVEDPFRAIDALPLLPDAEVAQLGAWGGATGTFPVTGGLWERFAATAAAGPDRVAVRGPGGPLTYAALAARATALGAHLRAHGVGAETRVGLCVERSADLVVGVLGILAAGGVYVPLDPSSPAERLRFLATDSALTLVVTDATHAATVAALGLTAVRVDAVPASTNAAPRVATSADEAAYVIYTSGSTGTPKGVVVTHGNVLRLLASTEADFGFDADDVWTLFHSYAFDFSVWEIWGALAYGGTIVVVPYAVSRTPDQFLALLADDGVTVLNQTPSAFAQLQAVDDGRPLALRYVIFGGEALDLPRLQPWFARRGDTQPRLVNMYGITETTVHVTYRALTAADATRASSVIGRALPDLSLTVLDPAGQLVPIGVPGELYVGGAGVARGYHAREALTAERFLERHGERVYRSGDLVRWLPTGELEYLGRIDQQVKIRGFRIELGEIEHVLRTAAGVREVAVLARAGADGPRLVAYVVPGAVTPTPGDLRAWCEQRLPDYMVPAAYVLLGALPLTGNGKLDRAALPAPDADAVATAAYLAPETPTAIALAAIWREVLQVERVGLHDNFFALGGDSILLLQVASRCARAGLAVTRRQLIEHQSIAELSEVVDRGTAVPAGDTTAAGTGAADAGATDANAGWPLTPLQEGLLFHAVSQPGDSVYVEQLHCTLDGDLDVRAFEQAWRDAIASHDILRAAFTWHDGRPTQHVATDVPFTAAVHDWRDADSREQDARFDRLLADDRQRGFDLARPPLMRITLLRVGARTWRWLWTHHHLILDGWSVSQLAGEVLVRYHAIVNGRAPALVARRPFRDYLAWLGRQDVSAAETFWREALAGFQTPSRVVVPPPAVPDTRAPEQDLVLDAAVTARLQTWARQAQVTPSTVVTAAWALLIRAYSGCDDVVFGVTVSGRPAELEGYDRMIGPFINSLPLRVRVDPAVPFDAWIRTLHRDHARMREFEHSRLVDIQRWSDLPAGTPLFDALMVFENYPVDASLKEQQSGLAFGPVTFVERSTYGLALAAIPAETLTLRMHFDPARVDRAMVVCMLEQLATLIERAVAGDVVRVGEWSLLDETERPRLRTLSAAAPVEYDLDRPVHALFDAHAAATPDRPAVAFGGTQVSYGELAHATDRLAAWLRERGAGPETLVGVRIERSIEMVAAILAIWKAGAAYLPLDPSYPERRLAQMMAESGVQLVVTEALARAALTEGASLDDVAGTAAVSRQPGAVADARARAGEGLLDRLAYVIYTSGSTGTPKGAQLTHRGLINLAQAQSRAFDVRPGDRVLLFASINFDASVSELVMAFAAGATIHVASRDEILPGDPFVALLRDARITHLTIPPSVLSAVPFAPLPDLRTLIVAGEACPPALAARWSAGRRFVNAYGPTENTVCATIGTYQGGALTIGRPMANVRIHILDADGELVPVGVAGEIHIGGTGVARGYLGRAALTAERFVPDPWSGVPGARMYRSGDLGRWRPDGTIEYLGRIDQQVKIRGHRIEPDEIAHVLRERGGAADASVLVVGAASGQSRLVAYVAARGRPLTSDGVLAACAEWLPDYMVPSAVVVLDDLPLTPSGKIDRAALPDPELSLRAGFQAPRSATEVALAEVWRDVLGVDRVGIEDNFFALGGDSIVTLQVVARAARAGVHIAPRDLFQHPTVAGLAAIARASGSSAARRLPAGAEIPLTPIQHWFFEQPLRQRDRWNQAVLVELAPEVDPDALEEALRLVGRRHDALRTRFTRTPEGWRQVMGEGDGLVVERVLDGRIEEHAERAHAMLHLADGPIARALHFAPERRLLVVIHHLAVDGVSWRVLLDEVERALDGATLAPATQFADWASRLAQYAAAAGDLDVGYWRQFAAAPGRPDGGLLRPVPAAGADTRPTVRVVEHRLSADETGMLLRRVPVVHQTRVNDVLLAAFAAAVRETTAEASVWVDLEGHGREAIVDDIDLSGAVGWFTSVFPVRLEATSDDPRALLLAVREQLQQVPRNGVEFGIACHLRGDADLRALPVPAVSFNYLGQLDQKGSGARFTLLDGPVGAGQAADEWRRHRLDVVASVRGDVFRIEWHAAGADCDPAQVDALAASYMRWLRRVLETTRAVAESPDIEDVYALTPMQQGLLFHVLQAGDASLYVEQLHGEVRGTLDPEAFARAWQVAVDRHAIFRTSFAWDGSGEPLQRVHRRVDLPLERQDWRGSTTQEQTARLSAYLEDDRRRGFRLEQAPLLRVALIQLAEDRWHWVWTHHHLLLDGWGLAPVVGEVLRVYEALAAGDAVPALPTRRPYRAYLEWLAAQDVSRAERYWRTALAGFVTPTRIRTAPCAEDDTSGEHLAVLSAEETSRLHAWARRHNLTVNTVVTAAWARVLQAFSGNDDVVFGVTVSGRPSDLAGSGEMIGLFINTLPLRVGAGRGRALADWLHELQRQQADQRQFEYSRLVDVQRCSDLPPGEPLFDTLLAFDNYPVDRTLEQRFGALEVHDVRLVERTHYPLSLSVVPADQLRLRALWDPTQLSGDGVRAMLRALRALLAAASGDRVARVEEWSLVDEDDASALLARAGADPARVTSQAAPAECLHDWFSRVAHARGAAVAVSGDGETLTYAALEARSNQLANLLRARGVGPEAPVGLRLERSADLIVGVLGILKAGGAYVPFDPANPPERTAFMLADSGVQVMVTADTFADPALAASSTERPDAGTLPDHAAYVIYTSGSTGQPKGCVVTHRNVHRLMRQTEAWFGFGADDVWTLFHSIAFDFSVWEIWGALLYGGRLVVVPYTVSRSPDEFLDLVAREQVTVLNQTPSAFRQFMAADARTRGPLALRAVIFGGEALQIDALAPWFDRHGDTHPRLVNMYGITETTVHVTYRVIARADLASGTGSRIGVPIPDLQLYVLDACQQLVPAGVAGELFVAGEGLARGYLGRPRLTAERMIPNPFGKGRLYRTGDLVRWREDGLEYLGRIDDQIKLRGFRIELGEIESVLAAHAAVQDVAVLLRDERLVAYVVARPDARAAAADGELGGALRAHAAGHLPDYMLPGAFVLLDAMPLTSNGKLHRSALPAPGPVATAGSTAPRTERERALADVWRDVLGAPVVGIHDNFFALGGDSIRSIQVIALARERGIALTFRDLFERPTIAELSSVETGEDDAHTSAFELVSAETRVRLPEDVEDAYPLTRLQQGMFFHAEAYHDVMSYRLRAPLDVPALRAALDAVTTRHPVLRTSVDLATYDEPLQLVHRAATIPLDVSVADWIARERSREFDLRRAPLLRAHVRALGDGTFRFEMSFHHAILDGWSLASLLAELFRDYLARLGHAVEATSAAPDTSFRDYVALERRAIADLDARAFWAEYLAEAEPALLPRRHDPVPRQITRRELVVREDTSRGLKAVADGTGVPLRSVLLAAHVRALALFTGRNDVVTGLVTNGRPERQGGDRVLGLFLNTVPFRQRLRPGTWRTLVQETFRHEQRLSAHRRFPMPEIQKLAGGAPLFDTDFNFVHFHVYDQLRGLDDVEVLEADAVEETNFTLAVNFSWWGTPPRLSGSLDYDASVLDDALMTQYAEAFAAMLDAIAHDADEVWTSRLLGAAMSDADDAAAPDAPSLETAPAAALLHALVARAGTAEAVIADDERLTYDDLHRRASQLAHALRERGVGPDVLVGVALEPCAARVVALLAVLAAGGAYVPIDMDLPSGRIDQMLADSGVTLVIARAGFPCAADVVDVETAGAGHPDAPPVVDVRPDHLAYAIYTSGSTGRPKGVLVTHRAIVNHMRWMQEAFPLLVTDRVFQKTPIGFDASVWEFWAPLHAGATLVAGRAGGHQDPAYLLDTIRAHGITILQAVPTLLGVLVDEPSFGGCRTLRRIFAGGEALSPALARRIRETVPGADLVNLYGPTETAIDATAHRVDAIAEVVPIGQPIRHVRARVLDAWLNPVPDGTDGELYLAGDALARGYLGQSALTALRFVADPWSREPGSRMYRTGDVVYRTPDGLLAFRRRVDDQVKVRGHRVELGEVEAVLSAHPAVTRAVATVIDGRLVAYVTGNPADDLRDVVAARLPSAMVPSLIVHLDTLPLTASGKVDRRALPAPVMTAPAGATYVAPSTDAEQALVTAWASVLGVARVGVADNFFDLGGDSILSLQIVARLRAAGWKLAPRDILQHQSIAAVAPHMQPLSTVASHERPTGRVPLLPIQRRFFAHPLVARHHWNQSTFLVVPDDFSFERFARALQTVVAHHDAFRLRFRQVDGAWQQAYIDAVEPVPCEQVVTDDLGAAVDRIQSGLDITAGPVLRAAHFTQQRRLLIVAHHLVVDAVSWRILLDDLVAAYEGRPLAAVTTSLQAWAERLATYRPSLAYWQPLHGRALPRLPVARASGANTEADAQHVRVSIEAPDLIGLRVPDILLGALGEALTQWTGTEDVWVDVEGHGRDDLFEGVDLSRTVGWFTSLYPVALSAGRSVLPARGLDYTLGPDTLPSREVSFNYLGRIERTGEGGFSAAPEQAGFDRAPENERQYLLDVTARIDGTRLSVEWAYASARLDRDAVARAADTFIAAVQRRIASGVEDELPLAPLQAGFLYHALDDRGEGAYLQQLSATLDGVPDRAAFQRAWDRVLARHAALRVSFPRADADTPAQVVARHVACPIEWLDWRTTPDRAWETLLAEDRARGFGLATAPLMRITVVRTGEDTCRMLWSHHHLILDGWSLPIVLREVMACYREEREAVSAALAPAPDYGACMRWLAQQDHAAGEAYWRGALAGVTEPNEIALPAPSSNGAPTHGEVEFACSETLTAELTAVAQQARVTLNTVVQTLWALTVATYSGRRDVVFGVTVSGRPPEVSGIEQMAGLFINTLPLRVDTGGAESLADLLREVQARQALMSRHESSRLVDVHGWSGVARTTPLFETILVFENYPLGDSLGERRLRDFAVRDVQTVERTHYPLTCYAVPGDRLRLTLVYRTDRFADASMHGMLDHLRRLAEAMTRGQLRPAETAMAPLRGPRAEVSADRPVHERVRAQAVRTPDRTAVICGGTVLTYRDLDDRAEALAQCLRAAGVRPGRIVAVSMERSVDLVVALLGVLKAGGAYLPLDRRFPQERLRLMVEDAGPVLTLTSLDVSAPAAPAPLDGLAASPDDLAYVIYTSGSTGRPKGVEIPHRALANALASFARQPGLTADDVLVAITTVSFDIAALELFLPLVTGATLVVATEEEAADADRLAALLETQGATVLQATPATWRMLLTGGWSPQPRLRMWCGGEAMPVDLASSLIAGGAELWNMYGPTETTIWSAVGQVACADDAKVLGAPIADTTLLVVDHDLEPVPAGVPGELLIGGAGLARGYHDRPALTAERFVTDAWSEHPGARAYRTGDRVRVGLDGRLEFLGRMDAQVKIRGFRVELGEIEAVLRRDPDVRDAAVAVVDGQRLAAFLVLDGPRRPALSADLAALLREQLPEYMVPGFFTDVEALPLTPNGKLDRRALATLALPAPESAYLAPRDAVETVLADLWRQVLAVERIGVRDDFFALGGHSLHVAQIVAWVRQAFRVALPLRSVFEAGTVERLAGALTALEATPGRTQQVAVALQRLQAMSPEERARLKAARQGRARTEVE